MSLLQAYKEWIKRNGEEPRLPALSYTNEQLFFISAAQVVREGGGGGGVAAEGAQCNALSYTSEFHLQTSTFF